MNNNLRNSISWILFFGLIAVAVAMAFAPSRTIQRHMDEVNGVSR